MEGLIEIPAKEDSPKVTFDFNNNKIKIEGDCFCSNPSIIFSVINNNINKFKAEKAPIDLDIDLHYMNTASNLLLNNLLENIKYSGLEYNITWFYNDEDILDEIEFVEYCNEIKINKIFKDV